MSLYGSLYSGVSGLAAQGTAISALSDNISNINTVGYKANATSFLTLVTTQGSAASYSSGGVSARVHQLIDQQGIVNTTGIDSELAISGRGFFVVNAKPDGSSDYLYTRAGSFSLDNRGNFVNKAGYTLFAWPLDNNGRLPGEPGNTDTTSNALIDSLKAVNARSISGTAAASTEVRFAANLSKAEKTYEGAGQTILFPATSATNYRLPAKGVIVPDVTAGSQIGFGDQISITPSTPGSTYTFTYGGVEVSNSISGGIYGATTPTQVFTGLTSGDAFNITNITSGTVKFTFVPVSPDTTNGQFNSVATLAEAISNVKGLSARVQGNFLYIAPIDGQEAMTFANVTGTPLTGLGLASTAAVVNRFSTLEGLQKLVQNAAGANAVITNPLDSTSLKMFAEDPLGTMTVATTGVALGPPASTSASIAAQLGISTGTFGPAYDPTGSAGPNLSSGLVQQQFGRNIRLYDSFGSKHDFRISFINIGVNTWSTEIYSLNPSEIVTSRTDGQIASGTVVFNGDASLRSVSTTLSSPVNIVWANLAAPSAVTFRWGTAGQMSGTPGATTIGKTDGLRQFDSDYNVEAADDNGLAPGLLTGVSFDRDGFVIANFSNGSSRKVFKVPIADFANPNGLKSTTGNVFSETQASGNFNLKEPGKGGVGVIAPSSLEQANVELSNELTKMIIAQRGYQANSKVIRTVNDMLDELNSAF